LAKKPLTRSEHKDIVYGSERWVLLEELRKKALQLMIALGKDNLETFVYGSVARGDVSKKSDADILVQSQASSFAVEAALEKANIQANRRFVVQATPSYAMKAHIEIDEATSVSFPLMKLRNVEREFYKFGGEADLRTLKEGLRVPGVDKRLMLVEPTAEGHLESTIVGSEEHVARLLGISVETVLDRVHALLRRDTVGRTGVFLKYELSANETFETALKHLADRNPAVRRRLSSLS